MVKIQLHSLLLVFILLFSGPNYYMDPELKPYHENIMQIINNNCPNKNYRYPMNQFYTINKDEPGVIAYCGVGFLSFTINFNKLYWDTMSEKDRYITLLHEYSHCFLKKEHVDNPDDYMYSEYRDLNLETVKQQFIRDVREKCQ